MDFCSALSSKSFSVELGTFEVKRPPEVYLDTPIIVHLTSAGDGHMFVPKSPLGSRKNKTDQHQVDQQVEELGSQFIFIVVQLGEDQKVNPNSEQGKRYKKPWKFRPALWFLRPLRIILNQCPERKCFLLGHSRGAWHGTAFLSDAPNLFDGAILTGGYSNTEKGELFSSVAQSPRHCIHIFVVHGSPVCSRRAAHKYACQMNM